jgi:hypothetical protein
MAEARDLYALEGVTLEALVILAGSPVRVPGEYRDFVATGLQFPRGFSGEYLGSG